MSIGGIPGAGSNLVSGFTSGIGSGPLGGTPKPNQQASDSDGATFGATLKNFIIDDPSKQKAVADDLAVRMAAGENIDPHKIAIETAKAGVEIQMATRTISQAVSGIRTLFQMQI